MDKKTQDILTPIQIKVLDRLFSDPLFGGNFYLTGGTVLSAFYLHHRYSDDLDFFTHAQSMEFLWPLVQRQFEGMEFQPERRSPDFLRISVEGLQVDFVRDVPHRIGTPRPVGKWLVDNLENITVNKVTTILNRSDPKDYVDLYFLLRGDPGRIMALLKEASGKDASAEPFLWSRLIGDVAAIRVLPRMIIPLKIEDLKKFYEGLQELILEKMRPA